MKRFFTLAVIVTLAAFFLQSCVRENLPYNPDNYWLSQERGEVVYSDSYCNYFVVETFYGYTIIRSRGGYKPFEGSTVYGNFSNYGTREMYNRSSGIVFTGTVTDFWLSYTSAQYALDYYCPIYGKNVKREFRKSSFSKE